MRARVRSTHGTHDSEQRAFGEKHIHAADARFVLSAYVDEALRQATYDKLDDGSYGGRIPACPGVVAFGATLRECEDTLRSTLEDWILVGFKLGQTLPVPGMHYQSQ